jgi:hypothetical protein
VDPTRSLQQEKKKLSNIHGNREPKWYISIYVSLFL